MKTPRHYQKREAPQADASSTSWEPVGKWYHDSVGQDGHYYHQKIVIPGVLRLMAIEKEQNAAVLDLACGQGVLSRQLPQTVPYDGLDISPSLIKSAKSLNKNSQHHFHTADASKPLPLTKKDYSHATVILALQNIEHPEHVIQNACKHLRPGGKLILVLNHPCFRIPRQSSWKVDEVQKIQYRRLDRYFTEMKIPIQANPSKGEQSAQTWSFHHPLSAYSKWLHDAGFAIDLMDEWCSDKVSTGKAAKMENRSREEFPLFLAIRASLFCSFCLFAVYV